MFKAIGDVVGRVFGTQKAVDNLLDKDKGLLTQAGSWVGNFSFTDQEKSQWALKTLSALEPFKILQRIMVSIIMVEWAILFNVIIVAICLDATTVTNNLLLFAQTKYAWIPVMGAVSLYLLGGVIPTRSK